MAASGVMKDCPNLQQLQNAIKFGDIENAKQLVSQLAEQKALLNIEPKKSETSESATRDIRVKVYLEDKDSSGASLNWTVNPYTTIKELKERLEEEQSIPQEVQKWIIGKRIRKDTETLSYCNVRTSGCSLYVYLLSASKVGLTRQDYENRIDVLSSRDVPQERAVNRLTEQVGELRLEYDFQQPARIQPQAPPPIPEEDVLPSISQVGWCCEQCTFHNEPTRPGCEMCGGDRPQDYVIPQGLKYKMSEKEKQRLEDEQEAERLAREEEMHAQEMLEQDKVANYLQLMEITGQDIIANPEEFTCSICFDDIPIGAGIILRECLHQFCKDCLAAVIQASEEPEVKCPHQEETYSCPAVLLDIELKHLVCDEDYMRYLSRSLNVAESSAANSYHCKTPDCQGWCYYDDDVNFFTCPICKKKNCLTCKAIHPGQDCKEYQDDLKLKAQNDVDARKTQEALEEMLNSGDAMECPQCKVVITKKVGCDWLRCSVCKTEICWVTKGRRWGPAGTGDTSGGCRCRVNGLCHPKCQNCH